MKTASFILYVLAAVILEFFLQFIFSSRIVVIVPEVIIFLAVIDLDSKNILNKVTASAVLYDLLNGQQIGVVSISILLTFGILYFLSQVSYIGGRRLKTTVFCPGLLVVSIFLSLLFGLYYMGSYVLEDLFFNIHSGQSLFALEIPPLSVLAYVIGLGFAVYLILFSFRSITRVSNFSRS